MPTATSVPTTPPITTTIAPSSMVVAVGVEPIEVVVKGRRPATLRVETVVQRRGKVAHGRGWGKEAIVLIEGCISAGKL